MSWVRSLGFVPRLGRTFVTDGGTGSKIGGNVRTTYEINYRKWEMEQKAKKAAKEKDTVPDLTDSQHEAIHEYILAKPNLSFEEGRQWCAVNSMREYYPNKSHKELANLYNEQSAYHKKFGELDADFVSGL